MGEHVSAPPMVHVSANFDAPGPSRGHFGGPATRGGGGGGATPQVLGRQLPLPPPPKGTFGQQFVAKGVALRRPWAPKAPDAP